MTEEEWLTAKKLWPMLRFVRGKVSDRKSRLFTVACCRHVWDTLDDGEKTAADLTERYAEGLASEAERAATYTILLQRWGPIYGADEPPVILDLAARAPGFSADVVIHLLPADPPGVAVEAAWCALLREVAGPRLFRSDAPAVLRSSTAITVAQGIYGEQSFDQMPILADALEDAGCDNADVLNHLRGGGDHVRGCWAVDLILGKE